MQPKLLSLLACFLLVTLVPVSSAAPLLGNNKPKSAAITQDVPETPKVAKLVLEGPTQVNAGDLVVISVEKSTASSFKWIVLPSTDNYLVIDGGKRLVFSSGRGGEYKFIVSAAYEDTTDVVVHTIEVVGPEASPIVTFTSKIADWCENIESKTKRDDVLALAQSFSSVALVMEGGNLNTPKDIVEATTKSNQDALGKNIEHWLPFRKALATELEKMAKDDLLVTTEDHIKVWKAVAEGLREYAATL